MNYKSFDGLYLKNIAKYDFVLFKWLSGLFHWKGCLRIFELSDIGSAYYQFEKVNVGKLFSCTVKNFTQLWRKVLPAEVSNSVSRRDKIQPMRGCFFTPVTGVTGFGFVFYYNSHLLCKC
jgi:hypothetical protein